MSYGQEATAEAQTATLSPAASAEPFWPPALVVRKPEQLKRDATRLAGSLGLVEQTLAVAAGLCSLEQWPGVPLDLQQQTVDLKLRVPQPQP